MKNEKEHSTKFGTILSHQLYKRKRVSILTKNGNNCKRIRWEDLGNNHQFFLHKPF